MHWQWIGFGLLMVMASYNSYNNNVLKDTLAISITNCLTSIFARFVIFSAFGYMSHLQNVLVSEIAVDGPGLVFVVYPQAFVTMPVAPLWAVLFFFMLLCLGLDSQFVVAEVMVTSLLDSYSQPILKYLKRKEFLVLVVCGVAFLLGIPNVMQGLLVILVFSMIQFKPARYEDYVYPPWAQGVGWLIALASIIWIPIAAVHTLWVLPGPFTERLKQSITPFSLDEDSESPYYKQKGAIMEVIPNVAIISSIIPLSDKPPIQTNL